MVKSRLAALLLLLMAVMPVAAQQLLPAQPENFMIEDIRVEGLQRITEGTVFNYLPVEVGDRLTPSRSRSAIRELYTTGFFQDVQFEREGDILVIRVQERAAISDIDISGNKALDSDELTRALNDIGLTEGEVFDPLVLDRIQQELVRQYFSQGRYGVTVDPSVTELERNRVRVAISIDEGDTAKIKHINVVGNTVFSDKELRDNWESDTSGLLSFWTKDDQYAREKLSGDLERLRSYYQDRGYVDFDIESTQVAISPDKRNIYVTANVREGEVFSISDVTITGDLVVDEGLLRQLTLTEAGETFSRKEMEQSIENMTALLANIGYAFANVSPAPTINREDRTVSLNYFVDPGKRVYVRRVNFIGNTKTKDEVLRREMRQFEGAWFSQAAVDRSKDRLQRLGYFETVDVETPQVPGSEDQIDVIVTVEERPSGSFQIGLGYSQVQGLIASISVSQDNFLGSGKRVGLALSRSSILTQFDLSYNNPYWSDNGVSRGFFLRYREFDQGEANISSFTSSEAAAGVSFGIPLTELDFVRFALSGRQTDINIGEFAFEDEDDEGVCDDINMNGICNEFVLVPGALDPLSRSLDANGNGVIEDDEREFEFLQAEIGWSRDSRNHFLNPTRGSLQQLRLETTLPGASRDYYKIFYRYQKYIPVFRNLVFSFRGDLGYGDAFDSYDDDLQVDEVEPQRITGECDIDDISTLDLGLPFYEHFYAGGVRDIRGFDDNTLGPKDQFCRAIGGDFKITGGAELAFPTPFLGGGGGTRLAVFLDVGNVYEDLDAFEADELRAATGLSLTWQAPIGPIVISFALPVAEEEGDRTETLQFTFGGVF